MFLRTYLLLYLRGVTVFIQRSVEKMSPILVQPKHNIDNLKTPTQQEVERSAFINNDQTKKYARQAVENVYKEMQKIVENTEYNVNFQVDELGAPKQIELSMKRDGTVISSIPPDAALHIAEKAKYTTLGLLFDYPV